MIEFIRRSSLQELLALVRVSTRHVFESLDENFLTSLFERCQLEMQCLSFPPTEASTEWESFDFASCSLSREGACFFCGGSSRCLLLLFPF